MKITDSFHLIDLISQARAVMGLLEGMTEPDKLTWLANKGRVEPVPTRSAHQKQTYRFTSSIGREAAFFFDDGGDLVFIGDHTTFTK